MQNTIDEAIAILQAKKAGKEIELRTKENGRWISSSNDIPDFERCYYRVKPTKPRQFILYNGGWRACGEGINPSEEIRVTEILPEEKS